MTAISYEAVYPAPAQRVIGALTDEAFLTAYAEEVGALAHRVDIERADAVAHADFDVRTRVVMTVPTAGVPAAFKRLVSATVDITEVRTWAAPTGGRFRGLLAVDASARGRAARVRGNLVLEPGRNSQSSATRFGVDGEVKVHVPLVGDLAAALVRDLVGSVIRRQSAVMERWLRER